MATRIPLEKMTRTRARETAASILRDAVNRKPRARQFARDVRAAIEVGECTDAAFCRELVTRTLRKVEAARPARVPARRASRRGLAKLA